MLIDNLLPFPFYSLFISLAFWAGLNRQSTILNSCFPCAQIAEEGIMVHN
jgi:hypothetical protein